MERREMHSNRIGYFGYRLYHLGWQSARHNNLSPLQHTLLSSLLHYRRGFAAGLDYAQKMAHKKSYW